MAADIFVELLTEGIQLSDSGLDKLHVKEDLQTHRDKNAKSRCVFEEKRKVLKTCQQRGLSHWQRFESNSYRWPKTRSRLVNGKVILVDPNH